MYKSLDPDEILYTHDSILDEYSNGMTIDSVTTQIIKGQVKVKDIPLMRVYTYKGKHYSQDNRRLYMFKVS